MNTVEFRHTPAGLMAKVGEHYIGPGPHPQVSKAAARALHQAAAGAGPAHGPGIKLAPLGLVWQRAGRVLAARWQQQKKAIWHDTIRAGVAA